MILTMFKYRRNCSSLESRVSVSTQSKISSKLKSRYDNALYDAIRAFTPSAQEKVRSSRFSCGKSVGEIVENYISTYGTEEDSIMPRMDKLDRKYLDTLVNMKKLVKSVLDSSNVTHEDSKEMLEYIVDTPIERVLAGVLNYQRNYVRSKWLND